MGIENSTEKLRPANSPLEIIRRVGRNRLFKLIFVGVGIGIGLHLIYAAGS